MADAKINPLNTRAFKKASDRFEITVGSIEEKNQEFTFKENTFIV